MTSDQRTIAARRALALLDLTNLNDDCKARDVDRLCAAAVTPHGPVAAVCVWPKYVARALKKLDGTGVKVATVANFPDGEADVDRAVAEVAKGFADGADEVDVVIPWRALAAGDELAAARLLKACRGATPDGKHLKAILETGMLETPELIEAAAKIALSAGVDFLKTSTGKTKVSATPEAAEILLKAVKRRRNPFGVKISGGVRTTADAALYLDLADRILGAGWAAPETFRFGASSLLDDLLKTIEASGADAGPAAAEPTPEIAAPPPQELIRKKRDGRALTAPEIGAFVDGLTSGAITEGQAAAFAMAVFFNGMKPGETVALTEAMRDSGETLSWRDLDLDGPVVDKHSTGGVGDNVSLMLAPMLAACGTYVPMISGRGLGHTGGTLDKLESIPGYRAQPDAKGFRKAVAKAGCAIIGQTGDLAPADRRLYAIRDVTATVESIPLITASILSKKLAAGLDALVLDVKTGSGAFMAAEKDAKALAKSLVEVANGAGLACSALLTDMDEPLASAAGNAVEVLNAAEYLSGSARDARLHEVTLALGAELLTLAGLARTTSSARKKLQAALDSGAAAERFERMVAALGGPKSFLNDPAAHLPAAPVIRAVTPKRAGVVSAVDARALGMAVVALGGGRRRADQAVDPAVGFTALAGKGAKVDGERPLAMVHARDEASAEAAAEMVRAAYAVGAASRTRVAATAPVRERFGKPEAKASKRGK